MKAYIRQDFEGQFASVNFFNAYDGFRKMGWEIQGFNRNTNFIDLEPNNIVVGYVLDFGVTNDGKTLLIEVNDAYSLGCYGLLS